MTPVDLIPFAENSTKLSGEILSPVLTKKKGQIFELLASHFMDWTMALAVLLIIGAMFNQFMDLILVTKTLKKAFDHNQTIVFSLSLTPIALITYFFISYFMNHGQSWGMLLFKKRIVMPRNSFKEAFKSAYHSTILCMSCGISYFWQKEIWQRFVIHDYLYTELFKTEEPLAINLLEKTDEFSADLDKTSDFKTAA